MLIQFSVKNYRSFKDNATLSLVANFDKNTQEEENVIHNEKYKLRLLKSAVIYGANASGKSKFIEALMFMKDFILKSSNESFKGQEIDVQAFKLNSESATLGTELEIIFIHNSIQYRYGFEVDQNKVIAEWLFYKPKTKETELFYREFQEISCNKSLTKASILIKENLTRENALFLSVLSQFNDEIAGNVTDYLKSILILDLNVSEIDAYLEESMLMIKNNEHKNKLIHFLKNADIGIEDIDLQKDVFKNSSLYSKSKNKTIETLNYFLEPLYNKMNAEKYSDVLTQHKQYNSNGEFVKNVHFTLNNDESSGTRKYFAVIGQIINVLENGSTLFVDELDSKLHPNLVCKIVSIFNSKEMNPNNAQLVFNTHDTNLLSSGMFRRDQVWFTEKDKFGASHLYSLADFKTQQVRKTESFEENYIRGKYGAIPFLGRFDEILIPVKDENEK